MYLIQGGEYVIRHKEKNIGVIIFERKKKKEGRIRN